MLTGSGEGEARRASGDPTLRTNGSRVSLDVAQATARPPFTSRKIHAARNVRHATSPARASARGHARGGPASGAAGRPAGFSEAWFGEHFSSTAEPIASPLAFFSSLVHQTRQIKFATGVLNLPQSHPAMVAAQVAQFDHLSRGRYLLGIGPGALAATSSCWESVIRRRAPR